MDILISGNSDIIKMIKEIPVDSNGNISSEIFKNKIIEIARGKEENEV